MRNPSEIESKILATVKRAGYPIHMNTNLCWRYQQNHVNCNACESKDGCRRAFELLRLVYVHESPIGEMMKSIDSKLYKKFLNQAIKTIRGEEKDGKQT